MESFPDDIQKACRLGDVAVLKGILTEHPRLINQVDSKLRWSPLYRTVICGHIEATQYLLSIGADPNLKNNLGETPLHQAADNSQPKLVKLLLKYKADPNMQQNGKDYLDGNTPLHQSAFKGDEKIVGLLLKHKADPNIPNAVFNKTALHYAVEYSHEGVVQLLVNSNASTSIKDSNDKTALDLASPSVKQILLKSPLSSDRLLNHPSLLLPSPEPVDNIPEIPPQSFALTFSQIKTCEVYNEKPSISVSTVFEPDAEKSQLDIRPSRAFSFGGYDGKPLINWLESVKLDCLYDQLINAGYDDIEQMAAQMISGMPITEESLCKIGIVKPGHRKRLLAALDEESRPYRSSRRTHRATQSNPLRCCMVAIPANGFVSFPELEKWLGLLGLEGEYPKFVEAGYDDLEHMMILMNTRWEITDKVLMNEVGINKQGYRYKILARLKADSVGFDSFKKNGAGTSRYRRDELSIEKNVNSTACSSCELF